MITSMKTINKITFKYKNQRDTLIRQCRSGKYILAKYPKKNKWLQTNLFDVYLSTENCSIETPIDILINNDAADWFGSKLSHWESNHNLQTTQKGKHASYKTTNKWYLTPVHKWENHNS